MAVQKPIPITKTGLERLRKELQELVTVQRPAAEYEDAKDEQAFIEGRIMTIEN